jgi:hypothetical protein
MGGVLPLPQLGAGNRLEAVVGERVHYRVVGGTDAALLLRFAKRRRRVPLAVSHPVGELRDEVALVRLLVGDVGERRRLRVEGEDAGGPLAAGPAGLREAEPGAVAAELLQEQDQVSVWLPGAGVRASLAPKRRVACPGEVTCAGAARYSDKA